MEKRVWKSVGKKIGAVVRTRTKRSRAKHYPCPDLVILAGGQARRMNGINKLLQKFDDQIQLIKIHQQLKNTVAQVWVNSHRDGAIYQKMIPTLHCYPDDEKGFYGPLMGMKSAWSYVQSDYVLFVPCDVTFIPANVVEILYEALARHPLAQVAYVEINAKALYPFCLLKRSALPVICMHLQQEQRSLNQCFANLHAQVATFENQALFLHSINSLDELQQHRQLKLIDG